MSQEKAAGSGVRMRAAVIAAVLLALAGGDFAAGTGPALASQVEEPGITVGIDTDVTGNSSRTRVGVDSPREACARLDQGQTLTLDVFVDEIPAERGVSGFQFDLLFDPALVVTSVDYGHLLAQAAGSAVTPFGETASADGSLRAAGVDFGPLGIEPAGPSEIGPGILARIAVAGQTGVGVGDLTLESITITTDAGEALSVDAALNAQVAVNTDCPSEGSTATGVTPGPTSTASGAAGEPAPTSAPTGAPSPKPSAAPDRSPVPSPASRSAAEDAPSASGSGGGGGLFSAGDPAGGVAILFAALGALVVVSGLAGLAWWARRRSLAARRTAYASASISRPPLRGGAASGGLVVVLAVLGLLAGMLALALLGRRSARRP